MILELEAGKRLEELGWNILRHNIRVGGVQIDLLGRDPQGILTIIEVKSMSLLSGISWKQKKRLLRASLILGELEPVQFVLVQISQDTMQVLPVDGLTV